MDQIEKYQKWIKNKAVDENTKKELMHLSESDINERFGYDLKFGTGGLRGIMEAGTNRMNIYTVRLATQGLANEICSIGEDAKKRGVVIAYDSRNNSKLFAYECASVLCANEIKTFIFDDLRPTPELSFAVRYLGCIRGIVITASHNPKEYNGYKVYGEDGGQIEPETANKITDYIKKIDIFDDIKISETSKEIIVGDEIDKAYIDAIKLQSYGINIPDDFKVVYTPLHGSGNILVRKALHSIGVKNLFVVPEQELPDGDFPTVKSPNPENAEAFTIAIEYAKKQNADIVFGTDPDSDRIGIAIKNNIGEYITLNGNQTGALLCEYILRKASECSIIPENPIVVKTIVTTEMIKAITDKYNTNLIDVLTGFKFIGEQIKKLEDNSNSDRFMFGLEESYGYLKGTYARDKDAVVASLIITELAAECKANGLTLYDKLTELYKTYGFYLEALETKTLIGIDGKNKIKKIMSKFRSSALPFEFSKINDYTKGIDGLPKSDVLKFFLKDKAWFAVRPSGTEPKIKFYFGVCAESEEKATRDLNALKKAVLDFADIH